MTYRRPAKHFRPLGDGLFGLVENNRAPTRQAATHVDNNCG